MASVLQKLYNQKLLNCYSWIPENSIREVMMGSEAYGVSSNNSDIDVYAVIMPPRDNVFPHLAGYIHLFDKTPQVFETLNIHHIKCGDKEYDINGFSICKYFNLLMGCNPNIIDSLFVPRRCVFHSTQLGELIRENRKLFLSKKAYHTFKGYAYAQLSDAKNKKYIGKRKEAVEAIGYCTKSLYHLYRLAVECEMILSEYDLELDRKCHRESMKAIREGSWGLVEVENWFSSHEKVLDKLYETSTIPHKPDVDRIRGFLLECLESHYGNLSGIVENPDKEKQILLQIKELVNKV